MNLVRIYWRNFQKLSKHSIQLFIFMYHSDFHGNLGCSLLYIHTKCRCAANLKPHLCMKSATNFLISPKIAVSREDLGGGADNFCSTGRGGWENFALQGARKSRGTETPLETM